LIAAFIPDLGSLALDLLVRHVLRFGETPQSHSKSMTCSIARFGSVAYRGKKLGDKKQEQKERGAAFFGALVSAASRVCPSKLKAIVPRSLLARCGGRGRCESRRE
jgi:hypothetical protein